ncbi:SMI1/KNR4 family protein [Hymenobacter chitinivorans]|uniref:Knr4/Smi1-like domain-containing protein n=1 Tax=Hymenobacter chitinivorans DSM 11115 TaxID=1121954 RepID=A0A2M9BP29_9BACT|nr:SMI1/KNR4 family protein [Hymenobacter chitinivorans]PJJ59693.1 hypothetical protein CLV45_1114 [Hymenobacter chitinivorans DSM 11115]
MHDLAALAARWQAASLQLPVPAPVEALEAFRATTQLVLPDDLAHYFRTLNGAGALADENFFSFYSLEHFESVERKLANWPDSSGYRDLQHVLVQPHTCYVFADYFISLMEYGIRLYPYPTEHNEIYTLCEGKYKVVAHSFSEFIGLYLADFEQLLQ